MATFLNRCCVNACQLGAVIPRFQNITRVRPVGDTLPPSYSVTPYPRFSANSNSFDCSGDPPGSGVPAGTCGGWLFGGDLHGVSAQEINEAVDDIMACGGSPIVNSDHNCYQQNGTIDTRVSKLFGWQGVLAVKNWHGTFGLTSNDACPSPDPNIPADQVKYRTVVIEYTYNFTGYDEGSDGTHTPDNINFQMDGSGSGSVTVNSVSGALTGACHSSQKTQAFEEGELFTTSDVTDGAGLWTDGKTYTTGLGTAGDALFGINYCCRGLPSVPVGTASYETLQQFIDSFNAFSGESLPPITSSPDNYNQSGTHSVPEGPSGTHSMTVSVSVNRTNTSLNCSVSFDETINGQPEGDEFENTRQTISFSFTLSLGDPYTSDNCFTDWTNALGKWDLSDMTLANLRSDSQLANLPLCIYDELAGTSPMGVFIPPTMNDLGAGLVTDVNGVAPGADGYQTTWAQRSWIDGRNFTWRYADGTLDNPSHLTSGATVITPLFDGSIISHNLAGSDRHFWFGYLRLERDLVPDGTDPDILHEEWFDNETGGFSDPNLPAVTLRWQNNEESQYDALAFRNNAPTPPGNYPQGWWTQKNGILLGAKYIQATQTWPSVNYGRPCGADKFSADQLTICAVVTSTPGHSYSVKITGNAIAPGTLGGIAVNDFIVVESDGIYKVTSIVHDGNETDGDGNSWDQYTLSVAAKIDDPPTNYNIGRVASNDAGDPDSDPDDSGDATYLGKLRFPGAAGICGRESIQWVSNESPIMIIFENPVPYVRSGDSIDITQVNNITAANGTFTLTRIDDKTFTLNGSAGNLPPLFIAPPSPAGLVTAGNININNRPLVPNGGDISTVLSATIEESGLFILIPLVNASTRSIMSVPDGIAFYHSTGQHLGKFDTNTNAEIYANQLHEQQNAIYGQNAWAVGHGVDYTLYDASSKRTGVHLEWSFNQRAAATGFVDPPTWYNVTGCTGVSVTQFNYATGNCAAVVGILPSGSPEKFENSNFFNFPAPVFDDIFGGFYQAAVMLTMPDPFWQPNFKPDGGIVFPTSLIWEQDNGTGEADQTVILESGHTQHHYFFPHHPLVEAAATPAGPLPAGITLPYDPTKNTIGPPYYPNGIPIGDTTGGYATIDTDWGFKIDACQPGNRFASSYLQFVQC